MSEDESTIFDESPDDPMPDVQVSQPTEEPSGEDQTTQSDEADAAAHDEHLQNRIQDLESKTEELLQLVSQLQLENTGTAMQLRRIQEQAAIADVKPPPMDPTQHPFPNIFLAKLTSSSKQYAERLVDNNVIADYTGGRVCTGDSDAEALINANPYEVAIAQIRDPTSNTMRYVRISMAIGMFPVALTQTGGSAGTNQSAACTFTYTVKDISGTVTLGTSIGLTGNGSGWRGLLLALTAATKGFAYFHTDGTVKLLFADEKPSGEQDCS